MSLMSILSRKKMPLDSTRNQTMKNVRTFFSTLWLHSDWSNSSKRIEMMKRWQWWTFRVWPDSTFGPNVPRYLDIIAQSHISYYPHNCIKKPMEVTSLRPIHCVFQYVCNKLVAWATDTSHVSPIPELKESRSLLSGHAKPIGWCIVIILL